MKTKELIEFLEKYPESEVWGTSWNGYVETYSVIDRVISAKYGEFRNDFFGTPGRMDKRVLQNHNEEDDIVLIGSRFGRIPSKEIDFGTDNIDYIIKTINGENGDPDLIWKLNKFQKEGSNIWTKKNQQEKWEISYNTDTEILKVMNYKDDQYYKGKVIGIETLRNIIEVCKINIGIVS